MSRDQQSTAKATPALEDRADLAAAPSKTAPILYWNLCQGIPPIIVESPRLFFAAQAIVLVSGVAIVLVLLLIF
jgi:hypothetical protein